MNKKELAHFHKIFAERFDDRTTNQPTDSITSKLLRILIVFAVIGSIWVFLSYRFAFRAEQDLMRMRDAGWISYNHKTAKIEAFKFLVTIEDVIIFPNNPKLHIASDRLVMFYNPIADRIRAKLDSEKLRIFTQDTEIYIKEPDYIISFDRGIASKDYDNFKFYLTSEKNLIARFAQDGEVLYEHDNINLNASNSTEEEERYADIYDLRLSYTIKGLTINHNYRYFERLFKSFIPDDILSLPVNNYIKRSVTNGRQEPQPIKTEYEANYRFKIKQIPAQEIKLFFLGKKNFVEVLRDFNFFEEKFNFYLRERAVNKLSRGIFKFSIVNDGQYLMTDMDMKGMNYLANQYKIELLKVLKPYLQENIITLLKQHVPQSLVIEDKNLIDKLQYYTQNSLDIIDQFGRVIANIEDFTPHFYARHNYRLNDQHSDFILHGKNIRAKFAGTYQDEKFDGYLTLSYFNDLFTIFPDIYERSVRPNLTIAAARKQLSPKYLVFLTNLSNNLRNNGLDFLTSIHEEEKLATKDNFNSHIVIDFNNWQNLDNFIKVNDCGLIELFENDERVKYFIKQLLHTFEENKHLPTKLASGEPNK